MKKEILFTGLILITMGLILITSSIARAQEASEFTVPLSDPAKRGKLKAHLNYGSITVKGTARKDILVKYKAVADEDEDDEDRDDNRETNRRLNRNKNNNKNDENDEDKQAEGLRKIGGGGMDLEASESNNFVKVQSGSWHNRLNLEIEVPAGFDIDIHTYNGGDVMVSNIQGEAELNNYNGEITALNMNGSVVATTFNGTIKVTFDKVSDKAMSFSTFNGDIDILFPATIKNTVKFKTDQGEIFSNFDINFKNSGPVQKKDTNSGVYKVTIDEWKRGDINGGGAEVTMRNYNGNIYLRKK